ncbi:hypothetical protein INS49_015247 [Diaporthe citri]|uniref:uncharacterized protein n=1 Tax=Diaporthe citri TaxID=83186 RepID=UPI001C81A34A|nr:uncharacterized protein INS49_015247 [Diaporthe citri]KAG6355863.1 hypothetical protein INS49_015247 [Diaporthe citri]
MFDVDWSDPNRESVGDRRARKQKEREFSDKASSNKDNADKDSKRDGQSSQASGSGSVRSSISSVDKQFGFFGGKNRKKGRALGNSKSAASSTTGAPTIHEQEPTEDIDNNIVESPKEASSHVPQDSEVVDTEDQHPSVFVKPHSSFPEAVFNTWNENLPGGSLLGYDMASPKPGLKSTLTQHLGDGISFITKTTEVRSQPRDKNDPDYLVSKVTLSAGPSENESKDLSAKPTSWQPPPQVTGVTHSLATVPESPSASNLEDVHHLVPMITDLSLTPATNKAPTTGAEPKHGLKRKPKAPLKAPAIVPANQQYVGNPDLWKAPEVWEYSASEPEVSPVDEAAVPIGSDEINQLALDLASMQREANRMLQASPRTILLRLKAKWGDQDIHVAMEAGTESTQEDVDIAVDRALMYKELEMDRKRWMLSALHHMETDTKPNTPMSKPKVKPKVQKILSLFDSQAVTSYLAISNPSVPIYHLSPDPLSHRRYPNIHPMTCPAISASAVGVATEAFSAVNCLPIASILPSSDLPRLLQNIFRVLAPGGFLNMVIVDPLPTPSSAGPALRQWLDENLIFNLEQQFRCTNPSRNFPVWLLEAGMRAKGSVITTTRFQAVIPQGQAGDGSGSGGGSSSGSASEMATMRELRTTVGRMLWREIWGPFVGADSWWWEVPKIVDECLSRDTCWEYSVIAACKESEA